MAKKKSNKKKKNGQNKNMSIGDKAAMQGIAKNTDDAKDGPFGKGTFAALALGAIIFVVILLVTM